MTRLEAFMDGFMGQAVQIDTPDLWELSVAIKEKQNILEKKNRAVVKKEFKDIINPTENKGKIQKRLKKNKYKGKFSINSVKGKIDIKE